MIDTMAPVKIYVNGEETRNMILDIMNDGKQWYVTDIQKEMSKRQHIMTYQGVMNACMKLNEEDKLECKEVKAGKKTVRTFKLMKQSYKLVDTEEEKKEESKDAVNNNGSNTIANIERAILARNNEKPIQVKEEQKEEQKEETPKVKYNPNLRYSFQQAIVMIYNGQMMECVKSGDVFKATSSGIVDLNGIPHPLFTQEEMNGIWMIGHEDKMCPFCGRPGKIVNMPNGCFSIQCTECMATIKPARTVMDAKARWNRRV